MRQNIMPNMKNAEIQFLLQAVRQASALAKQVQAEMISPALMKEDRSPVTVADLACQALVGFLLHRAFPGDILVAEEDASALCQPAGHAMLEQVTAFVERFIPQVTPAQVCDWIDTGRAEPAGRYWTLDPIDGTKGFLRGDQYAVALALIADGKVQAGALGCPNLSDGYRPDSEGMGSLVIAARGQGTWNTLLTSPDHFEQMHVSSRSDPSQTRILRSYESGHTNVEEIDQFARSLKISVEPVRMDSQAKYAILAAGKGDLILRLLSPKQPDYQEKIWDQAAGSLIVEEAGGRITDLFGQPLDFNQGRTLARNRGILATNGLIHEAALNALAAIGAH
jgi:3'(2'), 5'-bisphosphate nucleotidase